MGCSFALIYVFVLFTSFLHPFLLMENNHEQTTFHINDCYWSATVSRGDWGLGYRLTSNMFVPVPSQDLDFQRHMSWSSCVQLVQLRSEVRFVDIGGIDDHHCWEVIVRFVDIGGIDDHHCLSFLFIINNRCSIYL